MAVFDLPSWLIPVLLVALGFVLILVIVGLLRAWTKQDPSQYPEALASDWDQRASQLSTSVLSAPSPLPPKNAQLNVGHRTDVGRKRSVNEDSFLTLDLSGAIPVLDLTVGLFVVADGMGGHAAGEVASRLAIEAIARSTDERIVRQAVSSGVVPDAREWLTTVGQTANQSVHRQRQATRSDMGTTLVMALFFGNRAVIGNAGDSRAYALNGQGIVQITTDHSLVERFVALGQITADEAAHHPQKNVIYRVVGDKESLSLDLFERRFADGEALLLCSDGLSNMVRAEEMWRIWKAAPSPQEACNRLVEVANRAGGEDNITVIIVDVSVTSRR